MTYAAIYLSPHLDDAALSCGGQIYDLTAAGQRVLIVTTMAADPPLGALSPFAHQLHERWGLATEVMAQRRAEDAAACAVLGADYVHWDFWDCIYRTHPRTGAFLYDSVEALFGEVHGADTAVRDKLATRMAALPPAKRILAPLTVGNHVDHQLVRAAAEICFGQKLRYYEDYPYVRKEGALEQAFARAPLPENAVWSAAVTPVSAEGVAARVAAIAAFASQVGMFFTDQQDLETQIQAQVAQTGGERLWWYQWVA